MNNKIGLYYDERRKKPWICRWSGEYDPIIGKAKRYSKAFKLKRDAESFQAEQTAAFQKGQQRDKLGHVTLQSFCKDVLKAKSRFRQNTVTEYETTTRRLLGYFGPDCLLQRITPRLCDRFIAELKPLTGHKFSGWTRKKILKTCKAIFELGISWGLVFKNPFKKVQSPKCALRRWHYVRPCEYHRLLDVAPSLQWKGFYALVYTAGLRFGELFSLTWSDIDFETGEVVVQNRPATSVLPPFFVKNYETRRIPLPKHTLDILAELQAQAPEKMPYVLLSERQYQTVLSKWQRFQKQGRAWRNQDVVNNTLHRFKLQVKRADIKPDGTLSIHTLRKSCITNWANEINNPEAIRQWAGHKDISTTMQFYSQTTPEQKRQAAIAIDALLKKSDAELTPESVLGSD